MLGVPTCHGAYAQHTLQFQCSFLSAALHVLVWKINSERREPQSETYIFICPIQGPHLRTGPGGGHGNLGKGGVHGNWGRGGSIFSLGLDAHETVSEKKDHNP